MRVLYLNPFSQEISGPDESLLTLLGALIPGGVEAHVVLPAPGPPVERYRRLGATVHFAPLAPLRRDLSLAAATYPLRLVQAAKAVARTAREIRADLIHTNMEVERLPRSSDASTTMEGSEFAGRLPNALNSRMS